MFWQWVIVLTSVDDGILSDDTEFSWVSLDDLEFNGPHSTANEESVTLADRAIGWKQ